MDVLGPTLVASEPALSPSCDTCLPCTIALSLQSGAAWLYLSKHALSAFYAASLLPTAH